MTKKFASLISHSNTSPSLSVMRVFDTIADGSFIWLLTLLSIWSSESSGSGSNFEFGSLGFI